MISESVQEFCKQYGLSGVTMEEGGSLNLTIDDIGNFQLVHKQPAFLTGLSRKVENFYLLQAQKILAHAHYRKGTLKPLHIQLKDDRLGLYYIFQEREISATTLSQALDSLTEVMNEVFQSL